MVWADDVKKCDYCGEPVSIYAGITEYGKWLHEQCYIHRTQKEIDDYKKKWFNKKLNDGDKADLIDKYNLVQKLMIEKTEFKGFVPIGEYNTNTPEVTEKSVLYLGGGVVAVDENGFPIIIETESPSVSMTLLRTRPSVAKIKNLIKPKQLTVKDIPLLMEALP